MDICVFCSSASDLDQCYVQAAEDLGKAIAERGHTLVFGGYDMGLMGAAAKSALAAGGKAIGITTEGLSRKGRSIVGGITAMEAADLAERKSEMVRLSDAFVTLPGGLGTLDEFFSVISSAKAGETTGKIALLNVNGYFDPLIQMLDESCAKGLNRGDWRTLGNAFSDVDELLSWLEQQ